MAQNTCERRVGRLVEVRLGGGFGTIQEIEAAAELVASRARELPSGTRYVLVADWREVKLLSQEVCLQATHMFTSYNPSTERAALLANTDSPTALWQLRRLVAAAQNDRRQVFASPSEVTQWLGEVLTAEERARLAQFLGGPDHDVRTGT